MAQEITLTGTLSFFKAGLMTAAISRSVDALQYSVAGNAWHEGVLAVTTAQILIPMGQVVQPHWAYFRNLGTIATVQIRNGSGGLAFLKLLQSECAFVPLEPTCVPYAIASADLYLEYFIVSL